MIIPFQTYLFTILLLKNFCHACTRRFGAHFLFWYQTIFISRPSKDQLESEHRKIVGLLNQTLTDRAK